MSVSRGTVVYGRCSDINCCPNGQGHWHHDYICTYIGDACTGGGGGGGGGGCGAACSVDSDCEAPATICRGNGTCGGPGCGGGGNQNEVKLTLVVTDDLNGNGNFDDGAAGRIQRTDRQCDPAHNILDGVFVVVNGSDVEQYNNLCLANGNNPYYQKDFSFEGQYSVSLVLPLGYSVRAAAGADINNGNCVYDSQTQQVDCANLTYGQYNLSLLIGQTTGDPLGSLDNATCNLDQASGVYGWAGDPDDPNSQTTAEFHLDSLTGPLIGTTVANLGTADQSAQDICNRLHGSPPLPVNPSCTVCFSNANPPQCRHRFNSIILDAGFNMAMIQDGASHQVYAVAKNKAGTAGTDREVNNSPKTIGPCSLCPGGICAGTVKATYFDKTAGGTCAAPAPKISGLGVKLEQLPVNSYQQGNCQTSAQGATNFQGHYQNTNLCANPQGGTAFQALVLNALGYDPVPSLSCGGSSVTITPGQTGSLLFGLDQLGAGSQAWYQTKDGGGVYGAGGIRSSLPAGQFLAVASGANDPGVVSYGGGLANFGSGGVSNSGWLAQSLYGGKKYGYDYFYTAMGLGPTSQPDYPGNSLNLNKPQPPFNIPNSGTAFYASGNVTIDNVSWNLADTEKITLLVDGNLIVKKEIHAAAGGFLAFIVKGNIFFAKALGRADNSTQPLFEGVYIADGTIHTGDNNVAGQGKFVGAGIFVGWTGIDLQRDLSNSGGDNSSNPAELFIYRPDFLQSAPGYLTRPRYEWTEVAP